MREQTWHDRWREVSEELMPGMRAVGMAQQFHLLTIEARCGYDLPSDSTPIAECWLENAVGVRMLLQHVSAENFFSRPFTRGVSACFTVYHNRIHFWPVPDAEYRIGWIQREQRPQMLQGQYIGYGGGLTTDWGHSKADQKSIALLKEWLTPEQLKDFEQTNSFDVTGCHSRSRYRISKARSFGVRRMDKSNNVDRLLCFVPTTVNSLGDIMLAQKIMLETNETKALKIANRG